MTRRWPDLLPPPSWPEYGLQPAEQSLRSPMEVGSPRVRRLTRARTDIVTPEWRMTDAEFWAFQAWFNDDPVGEWGSDSLTGWTFTGGSAAAAPVLGPSDEPVDALVEDGATGAHRTERPAPGLIAGTTAIVHATVRAQARSEVWVELTGRDAVARYARADLSAGTLGPQSGVSDVTLTDRGNGWWRLRFAAAVGTGAPDPVVRIAALSGGGTSYAGASVAALSLAELQVRRKIDSRDLFVPAGDDGRALGAAGGSAWFLTDMGFGGGLTRCEARFTAPFGARPTQGLNWQVRGSLEVRDA